MRKFLRFPFSGNDVHKIVLNTVQVEDVDPVAAPPAGSPPPGSIRLRFRQGDPGPVQIRPLLPGSLRFLPDPAAPGTLPDPADVDFTDATYATWKVLGRLLVTVEDRTARDLAGLAPALPAKPNRIWYGPVRLPQGFLFTTLREKLAKATIRAADGRTVRPANADWPKYAVAEFLAGRYTPSLRLGGDQDADAPEDDVIKHVMPTVEVPADGNIELLITTALAQKPQDAADTAFDPIPPAAAIDRTEPLHPRNGLIPAREVHRSLRADMVAEAASEPLRDAILADWPAAPRFFAIRFTRTWEPTDNCSVHLARQTVAIQAAPAPAQQQPLPAHGIAYFRQVPPAANQPAPAAPAVNVSLTGTMTWLEGGGTSWRDAGGTAALPIDLAAVASPHVAVRLPMSEAMFSDTTRPRPGGLACTYLSLRRSVRALVDNRIAGGRLNFGVGFTSAATRGIIQRAFTGTPANVNRVANNAPDPLGDPGLALQLEPILQAFFPDPAPQQPIPNPPAAPTILNEGEMAYRLWQTIVTAFESNATKRNYSDDHIGRGGPGSMVAVGLASYHVDPTRNAGEADAAYFDRIVGLMLAGLDPGAPLQFWNFDSDFTDLQARTVGAGGTGSFGHSPLFVRYTEDTNGNVTGLRILDQQGESNVPVTGAAGARRLDWHGNTPAIWIAANWDE